MHCTISRLTTTALTVGMVALMSACTQGEPGSVNPASIGNGSSISRTERSNLKSAPTPAPETAGVSSAPSFGPSVGGDIDSGIGIQHDVLIP